MRKGDVLVIEMEWRTVLLSNVAGKEGSVRTRHSWHVVKALACTREGKVKEVVDADGIRYKMCEKLREVREIRSVPEVCDAAVMFADSCGTTWATLAELQAWAELFVTQAPDAGQPPSQEQLPMR